MQEPWAKEDYERAELDQKLAAQEVAAKWAQAERELDQSIDRVVACIVFCDGIPTETLEAIAKDPAAAEYLRGIIKNYQP